MKKKFKRIFLHSLLIILYSSFFSLPSCRKADRDTDTATEMITDNAFSLYIFNDLLKQVHQFALSDSSLNSLGSYFVQDTACIDTVIHTNGSGSFPDTVTVNYGTSNETCYDGKLRRGKLKIVFSGKYGVALKNLTIYPEGYYLNDNKLEGKIVISCKGRNTSNNLYFSVDVENGIVSNDSLRYEFYAPSNGQASGFQREWISGETTLSTLSDDIFQLTGTYGGTASKGTAYKTEITSAIKDQFDCKWPTAGKEKLVPGNLSPREIDYGSGCDNKSLVKINGKEFEVVLLP